MTLEVVKIIDEMVDLRTGAHDAHGMVVSNGFHEVFISLNKDQVVQIVNLYSEGQERLQQKQPQSGAETRHVVPPKEPQQPVGHDPYARPEDVSTVDAHLRRQAAAEMGPPQVVGPALFVPSAPQESEEPEEPAPGEEYEDELTGVASF